MSFLAESKAYMEYDKRSVWGRVCFWLGYPIVWVMYRVWMFSTDVEREAESERN